MLVFEGSLSAVWEMELGREVMRDEGISVRLYVMVERERAVELMRETGGIVGDTNTKLVLVIDWI